MSRRVLFLGFLLASLVSALAAPPAWWSSRGATDSNPPNDDAAVNQGQLKQFTQKAVQELNARIPGGAGADLNSLVNGWVQAYQSGGYNATNPLPADFEAMNSGQLKWIANKVHARLIFAKYEDALPAWLVQNQAADHQLVNLGQLKTVFNFDLTAPSGQLPDWWQKFYFDGQTGIDPTEDYDGDGLNNAEEYANGLMPDSWDTDGDDLPDGWEIANDLDALDDGSIHEVNGTNGDPDEDGIFNLDEYWYDTNPRNPDTDSDGLSDDEEIYDTDTDPTEADSDHDGIMDPAEDPDHDGLTNLAELRTHLTFPYDPDTDNDTLLDGWEIANGLDPRVHNSITDPDGDGLTNAQEQRLGTAPLIADTDNDQILDGAEDPDGDGLSNLVELNTHHTDPLKADTDGDELTDSAEINTHHTDPSVFDTDGDTLPDGFEVLSTHLDPLIDDDPAVDFEPDGMSDQYEAIYGFNPDVNDSSTDPDGDGLTTAEEVVFQSDPTDADIDSDGLNDFQEKNNLPNPTDPWKWDTDGDGLPDKWEIAHGLNPVLSDNTYLDDDLDGLSLEQEYRNGTDPAQGDSDGDGALDGAEVAGNTSPTDGDWGGIPPAAPGNIQTSLNTDGTTTFTWNDHSNNERGFRLRVKPPDGVWILLGDVPAGTTTFATTGPQELSADGSSVEVESYNPFGGSFAANGAPGPNGEPAPGSGTPTAPEPPPETYKASFEIRSDGKEVANSCARCHDLEVQVDGKKYADSGEITLTKKKAYDITVVDTPVVNRANAPKPPHFDSAKFTIWPKPVGNQTIAVSPAGSKEPDVFVATEGEILHYIIGNHEKLLVKDKAWPKDKAQQPMSKKAVITADFKIWRRTEESLAVGTPHTISPAKLWDTIIVTRKTDPTTNDPTDVLLEVTGIPEEVKDKITWTGATIDPSNKFHAKAKRDTTGDTPIIVKYSDTTSLSTSTLKVVWGTANVFNQDGDTKPADCEDGGWLQNGHRPGIAYGTYNRMVGQFTLNPASLRDVPGTKFIIESTIVKGADWIYDKRPTFPSAWRITQEGILVNIPDGPHPSNTDSTLSENGHLYYHDMPGWQNGGPADSTKAAQKMNLLHTVQLEMPKDRGGVGKIRLRVAESGKWHTVSFTRKDPSTGQWERDTGPGTENSIGPDHKPFTWDSQAP